MSAPLVIAHPAGRLHVLGDGRVFHVGGRKKRPSRGPRLRLASYIDKAKLTGPAPDVDYSKTAQGLSDVLGNNRLGDCTCAGVGHLIDIVTGAAGSPAQVTEAQAIALYEAACGYNPADPKTDQGGDEVTVLDYVCEHGLDGKGLHKFDASISVNWADREEVRLALYWFGNLYFGAGLPDSWLSPFPSSNGFVWGPGTPNDNNGHCFVGVSSSAAGIGIDTWGLLGTLSFDATAVDEVHTVLTCDWFSRVSQLSPAGLAYQDLLADMKQMAVDNLLDR